MAMPLDGDAQLLNRTEGEEQAAPKEQQHRPATEERRETR